MLEEIVHTTRNVLSDKPAKAKRPPCDLCAAPTSEEEDAAEDPLAEAIARKSALATSPETVAAAEAAEKQRLAAEAGRCHPRNWVAEVAEAWLCVTMRLPAVAAAAAMVSEWQRVSLLGLYFSHFRGHFMIFSPLVLLCRLLRSTR